MEINMKLKTKLKIELLWSVMGGMLFSMLPMFETGTRFDIYDRWLYQYRWDGIGELEYLDEFIFGFIFTYIFVVSLRKYNETN
jgi:hypothetical protein